MPFLPSDLGGIPDPHTVWSPPNAKVAIHLYIWSFIVGGQILLPILLATFVFSKNVKRHPTLLNLLLTLSVTSVFSALLAYTGKEIGPQPSKRLCTAQAALEAGVTPMWAMATFALVYNVWTHFAFTTATVANRQSQIVTNLLVAAPYVVFIGFFGGDLYLGLTHPEDLSRDRRFFFCSVYNKSFIHAQAYFSCAVFLVVVILELHITYSLFQNRRAIQRAGHRTGLDLQHVVRILTFGLFIIAALIASVVATIELPNMAPQILFALAPVAAFIIFGTQRDVLRVWAFWRAPAGSSSGVPVSFDSSRSPSKPSTSFSSRQTAAMKTRNHADMDIGYLDTHVARDIHLDAFHSPVSDQDAGKAHFYAYDIDNDTGSDLGTSPGNASLHK